MYSIDESTGGLEISHRLVLPTKDYPGCPGPVTGLRSVPPLSKTREIVSCVVPTGTRNHGFGAVRFRGDNSFSRLWFRLQRIL